MTSYRLLDPREIRRQLSVLQQAAAQQPGGLRDREYRGLRAGMQALANGREADFSGKRLGVAAHDLSDCAEIKLAVIPETRGQRDLGPSHRLVYREFEAEDGGPPYREIVAFEPRRDDRPFAVAAERLGRTDGLRPERSTAVASSPIAPIRQALPPDIHTALAAAGDVASARGAVIQREASYGMPATQRRGDPPDRSR